MTVACLVPAAGLGTRLGPGEPKALREVAGVPMLSRAVDGVLAAGVDLVVVAAPPGREREVAASLPAGVVVVAGGQTRQGSVSAMLAVLPAEVDVVLVHDAARALTPVEVFDRVVAAVRAGADAVVPVVAVADTVRTVTAAGSDLVDRSVLRAVQTPQGFARLALDRAHGAAPDALATDDAGLVERMGGTVVLVPGHEEAFKVTRPLDLVLAEAVVRARSGGRP